VVLVGVDSSGLARLSVFINPLVIWVWVGGLIMLIGGVIAVWPPPRTQRQVAPAAVPEAVQTSRAT
jgi:cytochrome c-type biogenesis protein CcmF